jgi:hypothetical protein
MEMELNTANMTINFGGEVLPAIKVGDQIWVVVNQVCELFGLHPVSELSKLNATCWADVANLDLPSPTACIPLQSFPMWLATIDANEVSPGIRAKLVRFQCEVADVLCGASGRRIDPHTN